MSTPDPFADLQPMAQPATPDPFADLQPMQAQASTPDPFADLPAMPDSKPPLERNLSLWDMAGLPADVKPGEQFNDIVKGAVKTLVTGPLKFIAESTQTTLELWSDKPVTPADTPLDEIQALEKQFLSTAPKKHWYENTPEALGSALGFLIPGTLAMKGGLAVQGAIGATLGAANMGSAQYEDAVANGADPDQTAIALFAGSVLGTLEAFPGMFFLNKINKITGGKLANVIRESGFTGNTKAVWETVKGALVEGSQEGLSEIGSNWIARDIAQYNPAQELGENFWDNMLTGGAVGMLLGGGIATIRKGEEKQAFEELAARHAELASDPINQIAGAFTPVSPLMDMYVRGQEMEAIRATRAQQATAEKEEDFPPGATPLESMENVRRQVLEPEMVGEHPTGKQAPLPSYSGNDTSWAWQEFGSKAVESEIETTLPKNVDGSAITVEEGLKITPVITMESQLYKHELELAEKDIKGLETFLKTADPAATSTIDVETVLLPKLRDAATALRTKRVIARNILKEVKGYVASMREVLGHDLKFIISDIYSTNQLKAKGREHINGYVTGSQNVPGIGKVEVMFIRLEELVEEVHKAQAVDAGPRVQVIKRQLFETITHEMGHTIFSETFDKLFEIARTGTPEQAQKAYETYNFIEQEYRAWLKNLVASGRVSTAINTKFAPQIAAQYSDISSSDLKDIENEGLDYLGSIDEFFADMTARLATQGHLPFAQLTEYFTPVAAQYQAMFEKFPQYAKNEYGNNWLNWLQSKTLESKIEATKQELAGGGGKGILDAISGLVPGMDPKKFSGLREYMDRWSTGMSYGLNLLQMVKENPHIPHWQSYLNGVEAWANYQRNMNAQAVETLIAWKALGKAEASQLSNALLDEQELRRRLSPGELSAKLTAEAIKVYTQIRKQFDFLLDEMHDFALKDANLAYEQGSEIQKAEILRINAEFGKMKARGYFPSIRFGKYTIEARATEPLKYQGEDYKPGQLITFPVFESQSDRDEAVRTLREEFRGRATVSASIMREDEFAIQGMPRSMLRALKNKLQIEGDLTGPMAEAIDHALEDIAPFRNFSKQFLKKRGIHGASEDMIRSFAYYTRSAAGHIARVKFSDEMLDSIKAMQQDVKIIQRYGGFAQNRQQMVHWMKRHFSYIMNPANELAGLRSAGFVAFLGFNIKSAVVNFMQIPTVAYPYLAARYRDDKAIAALIKGGHVLQDWVRNKKDYIDALEDEQGVVKRPNDLKSRHAKLFASGNNEGWLDQSLATELAIAASENNLDRGLHLPTGKRFWHNVSRWSAVPFHLVEKANRYVVAAAAYDLEYTKTKDHVKSVLAAKQAVHTTQYENARWNRPEVLRGKKAVALLFMSYVQNTMYFAIRDKGARRWWMMMLLLAGVMGLPGAEDLEDLIDFTVTKLSRELGLKNPKFQLRVELREALEELHLNPDLILHGLSQSSFGLGHVGELTGIPIPRLDLSGSLGMGNIIPGTGIPGALLQSDPGTAALRGAAELAGATGNLVEQFYSGLFSDDPDDWKRMEKVLPFMFLRAGSKAARYLVRGEETTASGEVVAKFDPHDLRDQMEIAAQAFGFTPSRVSVGWERVIAVKDAIQYYQVQQTSLQRQINWAYFQEDRESVADVKDAIREYNASVPFPELRMTPKNVRSGIKEYVESRIISGMGETGERKNRRLRQSIEEAYPDPYGDTVSKDPFADL